MNYPTLLCGVPPVAGCSATFLNDRRPIDNSQLGIVAGSSSSAFGQVFQVKSNQTANYNAPQVSFTERIGRHFTLNGYYTYGKNLQSVELQNNTTNPTGAGQIPRHYLNLAEDRTDDHIRHMFVTSLVWQLQYYRGTNCAWKALLKDGFPDYHCAQRPAVHGDDRKWCKPGRSIRK